MPLISVIIPVYNGEKYIISCIESLLKQTYKNYEIIVIDDGSTDCSLKFASDIALKNNNIRVIHTENKGVSNARNLGMDIANGDYITFVDVDDKLTQNALQLMYDLISNYCAELVMLKKIYASSDDSIFNEQYNSKVPEIFEGNEILKQSVEDHPMSHSVYAKLYSKELIKDIRFIEGRKIHEDSFFVFQCFAKCKRAVYQDVGVYLYYETSGSASRSKFTDKYFDILYFAERKADIIKKEFPMFNDRINDIMMRANLALLYNLCKTYDNQYKKAEKQCLSIVRGLRKKFIPKYKYEKKFLYIIAYRLFVFYKFYLFLRMKSKR